MYQRSFRERMVGENPCGVDMEAVLEQQIPTAWLSRF